MIPLTVTRDEMAEARGWVTEAIAEAMQGSRRKLDITIGTMIETPRAAVRADEIAEVADFFSFGTNDLTQMAFGFSRDDVESRVMPVYLEHGLLRRNPFDTIDVDGVGDLVAIAVERGRRTNRQLKLGRVRRARRRPRVDRLLPARSASTTCRARRSGCRWPAWRRRRPSSPSA